MAGQKVHERLYAATFIWNGQEFPCTHDDIVKNPPLMTGGFSPDTQTTVTVRTSLFAVGDTGPILPKKGDRCYLRPSPDDNTVISLQIGTVSTSVGDVIQKFLCMDANQAA